MHILVVDDEKDIADLLEIYLKDDYIVHKFYDSSLVMNFLNNNEVDLAILDIMMPGIDGFSLCELIRKKYNFPILFVTAKESSMDKVKGLDLGADDYITKPFNPLELLARVKANLRRYKSIDNDIVIVRGMQIDAKKHELLLEGKKIILTPREFEILLYLAKHKGEVIKTEDLFKEIWQDDYYECDNNTIMVHIRHIREKMHDTKNSKYIKTIWGVGYTIEK